jgi:hypothetical protein
MALQAYTTFGPDLFFSLLELFVLLCVIVFIHYGKIGWCFSPRKFDIFTGQIGALCS